jgi:hypothetical protein
LKLAILIWFEMNFCFVEPVPMVMIFCSAEPVPMVMSFLKVCCNFFQYCGWQELSSFALEANTILSQSVVLQGWRSHCRFC